MVQSSIVLPSTMSNNSRKRSIDSAIKTDTDNYTQDEEIKRPRIETNEAGKNRNRRLFGALLGTLNKFKDEIEKTSEIDKNRREINEKLHEKLELERKELSEKLRAHKEEKERREQEKLDEENRILQEKKELREIRQQEKVSDFLKTKTEPCLFYLPEKLTNEMVLTIKKQKEHVIDARKNFENRTGNLTNDPLPQDDAITDEE